MKDYNNITVVGNLTADPEMRYTTEGTAITKFRVAVNSWKEGEVDFIPVVTFRRTAEIAGEYLRKGKKALVSGRLSIRQYEKDGQKRTIAEINASDVQMLSPRDAND